MYNYRLWGTPDTSLEVCAVDARNKLNVLHCQTVQPRAEPFTSVLFPDHLSSFRVCSYLCRTFLQLFFGHVVCKTSFRKPGSLGESKSVRHLGSALDKYS